MTKTIRQKNVFAILDIIEEFSHVLSQSYLAIMYSTSRNNYAADI